MPLGHTLISILEKNFLKNWKSNDSFFNFQENVSKNRKVNVCANRTQSKIYWFLKSKKFNKSTSAGFKKKKKKKGKNAEEAKLDVISWSKHIFNIFSFSLPFFIYFFFIIFDPRALLVLSTVIHQSSCLFFYEGQNIGNCAAFFWFYLLFFFSIISFKYNSFF